MSTLGGEEGGQDVLHVCRAPSIHIPEVLMRGGGRKGSTGAFEATVRERKMNRVWSKEAIKQKKRY